MITKLSYLLVQYQNVKVLAGEFTPIDLDIWEPNSLVKENYWIAYTGDLFIVVKAHVGPDTFFREADKRKNWINKLIHEVNKEYRQR